MGAMKLVECLKEKKAFCHTNSKNIKRDTTSGQRISGYTIFALKIKRFEQNQEGFKNLPGLREIFDLSFIILPHYMIGNCYTCTRQ
jgi:hypothetical protein